MYDKEILTSLSTFQIPIVPQWNREMGPPGLVIM